MAVDKIVETTQLNSDLSSLAGAIRTKGGTSAQLAFPNDFVSAINDLGGGGDLALYLGTGYAEAISPNTSGPTRTVSAPSGCDLTKLKMLAFISTDSNYQISASSGYLTSGTYTGIGRDVNLVLTINSSSIQYKFVSVGSRGFTFNMTNTGFVSEV